MDNSKNPSASTIAEVVRQAWSDEASDVHVRQGEPVVVRRNGVLHAMEEVVPGPEEIDAFIDPLLTEEERKRFARFQELDFSTELEGLCRLRLNLFVQREHVAVAIRLLPHAIPSMKQIYLPNACGHFCSLNKGLVLVTGPTGSGKSTTLAAMLNHINHHRPLHILTVEDPVEYVYPRARAMVSQREVGDDTRSFALALRHSFRQDPDVVLVGEMRDLETMQAAITLAETGHLIFSTVHTGGAAQTVSRIVDSFPPHQQTVVRMQLAVSLAGVISQQLLPRKDGKGRVAAREVLVANRGVRSLIRENKLEQITTAIQTGSSDMMFTMDHSLGFLFQNDHITYEVASQAAFDRKDFQSKYGGRG